MSLLDEVYLGAKRCHAGQPFRLAITLQGIPQILNHNGVVMRYWDSLESARAWFKENGYLK